jgi:hypothetical protein
MRVRFSGLKLEGIQEDKKDKIEMIEQRPVKSKKITLSPKTNLWRKRTICN